MDKTDEKDAVLIARLAAQLRCYVPEPVDETWGRLRHLGARREQLIVAMTGQIQQMRSLLECVWPAALDTARQPFRSRTWLAALTVVCDRDRGGLDRTRRLGFDRFERVVRREMARRGGVRPSLRVARDLFTALSDRAGVTDHRSGAVERIRFLLADRDHAAGCLTDVEMRMTGVLDDLKLTGQGRPGLRLAAWRTVWGAQRANSVYAARYRHLTNRTTNKLTPTQAQAAIAAAILRHLHAVITTGRSWDPDIATHGTTPAAALTAA